MDDEVRSLSAGPDLAWCSVSGAACMDLGTVFKLSLYGLTALVGAILGAAEGEGAGSANGRSDLVLPFLSLPVVICGYLFTERRSVRGSTGGRGLSSIWANVLGLIALAATAWEFTSENREGKLLAGTHLLLYVTWIVLFQLKTVRLYWFVMALGILQLAVASVLTTKGWFGFCAILYMFGAVWTLSIFSLWRAEKQFEEDEQRRPSEMTGPAIASATSTAKRPSEVRGAVQHEDGTHWLTARFVSGVLMTTCSALLVSAGFFALIPRVWVGAAVSFNDERDTLPGLSKKTGLATTVRLGDLGPILESMDRVMEIQLTNRTTNRPMPVQEYAELLGLAEPLFRGGVLTGYDSGQWTVDHITNLLNNKAFEKPYKSPQVRQDIRLEPTGTDILFCLGQPLMMSDSKHVPFGEFNEATGISTFHERKNERGVLEYAVFSALPTRQRMYFKTEVSAAVREAYRRSSYLGRNTRLPKRLEGLKTLTRTILEQETARRQAAEAQPTARTLTPMEMAMAIEAHLRDSGQYQYSLDLSISDPNIDPVEDFLFNRKTGHCEYFASALTLMLRAAQIPARMVSGYKGGIPHPQKKGVLEIQQRFAHAWVEAWVEKDGWTTFDATPVDARSLSIASVSGKQGSLWSDVRSTLSGLWSENVLNMSLDRQEESIYKPMRELAFALTKFFQQLFTSPKSALETFRDFLSNRERWFSIGGGLFAFTFMIVLVGLAWLARWQFARIRRWMLDRANRRLQQRRRIIEFYERFVRLVQARGLVRSATQTQQEFADQVASAYSPELAADGISDTPEQISRLFYRVRFGDEDLSDADAERLAGLLAKLEQSLANG
jgi:transglutaminase-like putative cysteine protease